MAIEQDEIRAEQRESQISVTYSVGSKDRSKAKKEITIDDGEDQSPDRQKERAKPGNIDVIFNNESNMDKKIE